ncbi:MAG: DUF481 domain-containing protein [Verrucomicrobiota bacterium]|nr:DUF481 domain-containing protein [Verrucomicrobiota bacterium]
MKPIITAAAAMTMALSSLTLVADVVEIKDGSRLVGKIIEASDSNLKLETAYAGTITVPLTQVASFSTESPVFVRLQSGTTMLGNVKGDSSGNLSISGADGTLNTQASKVTATWPTTGKDPEITKKEAELAKLDRKWKYEAIAEVSGKSGNTTKSDVGLGMKATLESSQDVLKLYASYNYSEAETAGVKSTSADNMKGGIDYASFFYKDLGWYARSELEKDELKDIDIRSSSGAGITYRFANTENWKLNGRTGFGYRYESYTSGGSKEKPGLDFGLNNNLRFATWGRLITDLSFTPTLSDFSDYLFIHDTGLEIPLGFSTKWALRMGVNNEYNSMPTPGREKLDTTYYSKFVLKWE